MKTVVKELNKGKIVSSTFGKLKRSVVIRVSE